MLNESAQAIWETALGILQIQVSKPNYRTWLEKTVGLAYQDNTFIVGVPNVFVAEYLDKSQRSLIEKTLISLTSSDVKVTFQVSGSSTAIVTAEGLPACLTRQLNPAYVFDTFIHGKSNQLAYSAAVAVAHDPGCYNPLFICGGTGLGKTHLLHAIGHEAAVKDIPTVCVSAEQFTSDFVSSLRERRTEEFRQKYTDAGMLLVDDIQFIAGKEQTAESFFHIFNDLHNSQRQIVMTSDQPPKSLPAFQERLRSRFEWGLIADIQPPDFETRLAILQNKAKQKNLEITADVLEFIAQQMQQSIRELEGSLNRVVAYARLFRALPTPELAAQALESLAAAGTKNLSTTLILETVASYFRMTAADLKGEKRDKETISARRIAMYLLRKGTDCSLAQIGQELGGRDPAAVANACKRVATDIETVPSVKTKIQDIQKIINPSPHSAKA